MTTSLDAAPPAPPATSLRPLWSRLIGIVVGPRAVFEELRQRPAWLGAILFISLFSLVVSFFLYDSVILPTMMEQAEERVESSEQLAQAEAMYASPAMKIFVSSVAGVGNFIWIFVTGLLLSGACSFLLGAPATWKQGVSVAAHAYLVLILRGIVALPIMLSRGTAEVSLGPGVFFPTGEAEGFVGTFLASFLAGLDLFNLWVLALAVLGMAVMTKQSTGRVARVLVTGYVVVLVLWALVAGMRAGS